MADRRPRSRRRRDVPVGLVLWPGAGADRDHATLVAVEEGLAPFPVRREDFPNRRAGKKGPERADRAVAAITDDAGRIAAELGVGTDRLVLGGRSFGGRMCSVAAAEGLAVAGLVLLSYPLHPPGKPERARTEHLGDLDVPCLFVSGERDTFGTPEELVAATDHIPGPVTRVWVPGGHQPKGHDREIIEAVGRWLGDLGAEVSS